MMPPKGLLKIVQDARRRETLDRIDAASVCLHGEHQARARGNAVHADGACTAHAMFAADMRSSRAELMPDEIGKQGARLAFAMTRAAVQHDRHRALLRSLMSAFERIAPSTAFCFTSRFASHFASSMTLKANCLTK
jgi:hypothetical protein